MFGNHFRKTTPILGAKILTIATTLSMALATLGMTATAAQAGYILSRTFDDPTVTSADLFDRSVAISGNNVLIGAPFDDTNGINVGQAHLFTLASTTVPEPGSLPLFATGLLGLFALLRWRRQRRF